MLRFLIILAIIIYFLMPFDFVPDFLGPLGRIDDIGILAFGIYHLRRLALKKAAEHAFKSRKSESNTAESTPDPEKPSTKAKSPHEVLGVPADANSEEIDKAYKSLASQYHPDRVEHLGEELQELAHEKMIEISNAYDKLKEK